MQADDTGATAKAAARSALGRWLLAIPLLCGATLQLCWLALALGFRTDMSFNAGTLVIGLAPGLLYGLAAALLLGDRPRRLLWIVLLLCGVALSAVNLAYLVQYRALGELMLFPLYLAVVAMVELARLRRRSPSDAVQL